MAQFWRPSASSVDREHGADSSAFIHNRFQHLTIPQQRIALPIYPSKNDILYALENYTTLVVSAETGSGKSTQIPQFLHEAGWTANNRCIACTQPRRMAAITVATRVAVEFGCTVGNEVGYAVRFDAKCSETRTLIKFMTDGLLLRETMSDPLLSKYSVVLVDEAHERSLHSDLVLGLLKKIQRKRKDLRIIVTSATVDAVAIKDFFETNADTDRSKDTACIINVQGRVHPVDILYLEKPAPNYIVTAVETVLNIHLNEDPVGDILVFLPGAEEIDSMLQLLDERADQHARNLTLIPLYSSLPFDMQMQAFQPARKGTRKVIVATNIAETSVTIEGIRYVVDAGLVKMKFFDVKSGIDSLITCPVAQSSANQRAGRAGRVQPGKCFRLMTEAAFDQLDPFTPPEMQRADISWAVLQLKALGIEDVLHFDFVSSPPAESMVFSLELLYSLGALDTRCRLTPLGEQMAEMPVEPRLAKCLLASFEFGCSEEVLSIAAMCSVEYPFISVKGGKSSGAMEAKQRLMECIGEFATLEGDHLTLLNIYRTFETSFEGNLETAARGGKPGRSRADSARSWCDFHSLQYRILTRAAEVRAHLKGMLRRFAPPGGVFASCGEDTVAVRQCLVAGYFAHAAQLGSDGRYWTLRGRHPVTVHPLSVLARFGAPPEWVIFNDVVHTKQAMIREVTRVDPLWLVDLASHFYQFKGRR